MALTPEHAAKRMSGIGGSELPSILDTFIAESGDTVYGCPLALFYEKTGIEADYPFEETGPVLRGVALEPMVADMYKKETGFEIRRLGHKVSKKRSWEMVSIDRQIIGQPPGPGVLECKSVGQQIWYQIRDKGLPLRFVIQVQWAFHVLGPQYKWGAVAFLWADGWQYKSYPVERDQELINLISGKVKSFWIRVGLGAGSEPEKLPYKDKRCQKCRRRSSCQGEALIKAAGDEIAEFETIEIDEALSPLVRHRTELRGIETDAKDQRTEVEGKIVAGMAGRDMVIAGGQKVVHKTRPGGLMADKKKMEEAGVFEKYSKKKKDSKPLNFYPV